MCLFDQVVTYFNYVGKHVPKIQKKLLKFHLPTTQPLLKEYEGRYQNGNI